MLDEVEEALASLAGPGGSGMSDLGLLATEVVAQAGDGDSLLAEPEVLLGEAESAVAWISPVTSTWCLVIATHFFKPGAL